MGVPLGALFLVSACITTAEGGQQAGEVFGIAGCRSQDMADCDGLSGKTHRNRDPDRLTYMAPDGRLFLWTGDSIVKGRWNVSHRLFGTSVCYRYEGQLSEPDCRSLSSEVKRRDGTILDDPFDLATRQTPPYRLTGTDRRDLNQLLAEIAAPKAGRLHSHDKIRKE
ncbi:hypothetical protein AB4144_07975 [Rhizobiaceae sp. 2RAB30]